jgi:hypothetical protein
MVPIGGFCAPPDRKKREEGKKEIVVERTMTDSKTDEISLSTILPLI